MTLIEKHARALTMAVLCLRNGHLDRAGNWLAISYVLDAWPTEEVGRRAAILRGSISRVIAERMP